MKQVRSLTMIVVVLICAWSAQAQQDEKTTRGFDKEQFFLKRNAYIIAEVKLTSEEATAFIPLENEMKEQQFKASRACRKLTHGARDKTLTPEEYQRIIDCKTEAHLKEAQLEKEYMTKFKAILSPEKIYLYQVAESKFMRHYMRENKRSR